MRVRNEKKRNSAYPRFVGFGQARMLGYPDSPSAKVLERKVDMTRYKEDDPKACAIGVVDGLPAGKSLWRNESG